MIDGFDDDGGGGSNIMILLLAPLACELNDNSMQGNSEEVLWFQDFFRFFPIFCRRKTGSLDLISYSVGVKHTLFRSLSHLHNRPWEPRYVVYSTISALPSVEPSLPS